MFIQPVGTTASGMQSGSGGLTPPPFGGAPSGPGSLGMSDAEKLAWFKSEFRPHFDDWVIGPIKRLVSTQDALVAFILMSCAIDYLASFWWGEDTTGHVTEAYTGFIDRYFLPKGRYDAGGLYKSLRNGLVHLFTIKGGVYALKHNRPDLHRQSGKDGLHILNSENFCDDLIAAKDLYFNDVESNTVLLNKARQRYERDGFLDVIEI